MAQGKWFTQFGVRGLLPGPPMTKKQETALAAGALTIGAVLLSRGRRPVQRFDFHDSSIVITGARGLALELARQLGREGARLTIAARDGSELERARRDLAERGIDAATLVCDVGNREAAQQLVREVVARTGRIDVLINNAGVIQVGPLEHMQRGDFEEAMAVHFWGPLHTMMAALPVMKRQGGGRIVNISSIGGKIGVPHLAPYCASKFALTGLSESVRAEVDKDNIHVTTVCPGMMRTGSPFNAWFKGRHRDEFAWFTIVDSIPGMAIHASRAAAQVIAACRRGDAELVITLPAKLAVMINGVMPEAVATLMALANRVVLPQPTGDASGDHRRSGWQSLSDAAPSRFTALTERAAAENNQLPQ
jgi:NAD(P)-dependent dehydrogenase (short-subunit alcohol dehydrogenase family)